MIISIMNSMNMEIVENNCDEWLIISFYLIAVLAITSNHCFTTVNGNIMQ